MTILFDHFDNLGDEPVDGICEFWRPDLGVDVDGRGATTPNRVKVPIVAGEMTSPDLDPGPARVMLRLGTWAKPQDIVIPVSATPVRLTTLLDQYTPQPPPVVSEVWAATNAAFAARDVVVAAAEGIRDISADVATVAADKATTVAARDASLSARDDAVAARHDALDAAAVVNSKFDAATTAQAATAADRVAVESARTDTLAAKTAAESAATTATTKAADAAQSAADAASAARDALGGGAAASRVIGTAGGLTGGGDLTADRTLSIAANGVTNTHIADGALSQSKLAATGQISDALALRELTANKGVAGGYASLDVGGRVPAAQLPSYVDDVLEYVNLAAFPATGEAGKIYVDIAASRIYRWSGSTYVEISASPGSTDAVPEGASNRYFTDARVASKVASMFGSGAGTVAQGNDPRFTDARTPLAGTLPCDFVWVSHSGIRAVGIGDLASPMYVGRGFIVDGLTYQFDSGDQSGSTGVEIRKNGVQVVGSNLSVSAANQVDGVATDAARSVTLTDTSRVYVPGDRFSLQCTSVGTTPGKGLRVWVKGRWS
ncbi:hypothetical protein [Nocardia niigatensis]